MHREVVKETYNLLDKLDIKYEILNHEPILSVRDSNIVLPGPQVKNLVLKAKKSKTFYLVIVHDEKIVSLSNLAEALDEKRLSFASSSELMDFLHAEPGVVTPFGLMYDTENKINVIVDKEIDVNDTLGFHPFVPDITLNIQFSDFEKFLNHYTHEINFLEIK